MNTIDVTIFGMEGTRMYTAAILTEESAALLKQSVLEKIGTSLDGFHFQTLAGVPLPHHMTINLGSFDEHLNDPSILNNSVKLFARGFLWSEEIGACAALVTSDPQIRSSNEFTHITVCIRPPAKPADSNRRPRNSKAFIFDPPIELDAIVKEEH